MNADKIKNLKEFETAVLEYFAQGLSIKEITLLINKRGVIAYPVAIERVIKGIRNS
jgi:hypothetical protein